MRNGDRQDMAQNPDKQNCSALRQIRALTIFDNMSTISSFCLYNTTPFKLIALFTIVGIVLAAAYLDYSGPGVELFVGGTSPENLEYILPSKTLF